MSEGPREPQDPRPRPPPPPQRPPPPPPPSGPPAPPGSLLQAGGQVAEDVVSSLKGQPVMLLVLVLNGFFLGLVHMGVRKTSEQHHVEMTNLIEKCFKNRS